MAKIRDRTVAPLPPVRDPRSIGPWELCELVGEGSFTHVFRARPANLAVSPGHAIKLVRSDRCGAAMGRELIGREARAAAAAAHPNLIPVFAAQFESDPAYLVMPLLTGATLAERLARGQRFSLPVTLSLIRQVAGGLGALAAQGYRHGDVKPGNVMFSPSGHATLIDLGFACRRDEEPAIDSDLWLGTPAYAAPERFLSRSAVEPQSDIYSLGVLSFLLFAGRLPFEASSVATYAAQHVHQVPPDLHAARCDVPREIIALIRRMLAKQPLRRPTATELVDELARWEINAFTARATGAGNASRIQFARPC